MSLQLCPIVSFQLQVVMQLFVVGTLLYLLYKYKQDLLSVCIIFLCYAAPFIFLGKTIENTYKVAMLLFVSYVFIRKQAWRFFQTKDIWLLLVFVLFTIQFFISTLLYSSNTFNMMFSQYARYIETFMLFFLMRNVVYIEKGKDRILKLFYEIMLMQILISCVKWILFQRQIESLVGSFSIIGGAQGTTIPILGFIILWFYKQGRFTWKDWLYVLGLLFIGFTTGKRAIMFILPIVVAAFMIYVKGVRLNRYMILALAFSPIVFYLGVRLTPSLNPENQVWGSFDFDYAFNYAETYQFGKEGMEGSIDMLIPEQQLSYEGGRYAAGDKIKTEGRGGATTGLLRLIFSDRTFTEADLWGIGFKNMYGINYSEFLKLPLSVELNHKGSATGLFQSYVTTGLLGVLCTILFCFLPFFYCKHHRLRIILFGIAFWEYFLYTGMIFRTPVFMAILIFIIFYANDSLRTSTKSINISVS